MIDLNLDLDDIKSQIIDRFNSQGFLFGEIHYQWPYNDLLITLSNVSHVIKNFIFDDDIIYAEVEFLNNEQGEIAKELVNNFGYHLFPRILFDNSKVKFITFDIIDYSSIIQKLRHDIINKILN